jgi:MFS family permease
MLIVLNQTVIAACIINLGCMVINNGLMGTVLPIYATEELMISLDRYALLISSSTVGSVVGNLIGGFFSDKMGRRKMLAGGLSTGLISILGLSIFSGFYPLLVVLFFKGVFWGIVYGVIPAFIADAVPDYVRGKAIGTFRTFMDMGGLIGPIIMSTIVELSGVPQGYIFSFYFGAALVAGMILLLLKLQE